MAHYFRRVLACFLWWAAAVLMQVAATSYSRTRLWMVGGASVVLFLGGVSFWRIRGTDDTEVMKRSARRAEGTKR